MIRLFLGYDEREKEGFDVFLRSVYDRSSERILPTRVDSFGLPEGTNAFTLSRFLVPQMCGHEGHAIFLDASDMLCVADIAELDALFDPRYAVQVVKHHYKTRNPRKYIGTDMECPNVDYERKNWASVMIINCEHPAWQGLTRNVLEMAPFVHTLRLGFIAPEDIGELPNEWNRIVDEGQPVEGAKIIHWTAGAPFMEHYRDVPGADLWFAERAKLKD